MKFREKIVAVDAVQFLGEASVQEMKDLWGEKFWNVMGFFKGSSYDKMRLDLATLTGARRAYISDWIVLDAAGRFSILKKDVFEKTYEAMT